MNWDSINRIRRFWRTSWVKSAFINFHLLPFSQAVKFPIVVSKYTYFYSLSGRIQFTSPIRFGMVRIGFLGEDVVVPKNERGLLQIEGRLTLGENVRIGCGAIIRVEPKADLVLDDDVRIGSKCRLIAYQSIKIGKNTGMSWECQVMDSNMHDMVNIKDGRVIPMSKPIIIGANNWIGTRSSIMKGCITPSYTIIGANSMCNKDYDIPEFSIITGSPAKLVKTGVIRADYNKSYAVLDI